MLLSLCAPCASVFLFLLIPICDKSESYVSGQQVTYFPIKNLRATQRKQSLVPRRPRRARRNPRTRVLIQSFNLVLFNRRASMPQPITRWERSSNSIFAFFVVLTFDFFALREDSAERKSPGADAPRLALTVYLVFFVFFVVQFLRVIGLRAKPARGPSW